MKEIVDSRSKIVWGTFEKWGWFAVMLTWAAAFLFAAALAIIAFGTIVIYPFVGAEVHPSLALLADAILLVGIISLSFEMRHRKAARARNRMPGDPAH